MLMSRPLALATLKRSPLLPAYEELRPRRVLAMPWEPSGSLRQY
jgi:hypothetical protein